MKKILYSPGKINMVLDVGYLRQDNYHEIKSVVFPMSLCDKIEFDYEQGDFKLQTNLPEIDTTTNNFIIQIIHEMESIWDFKANVSIFIHKKIPILSGLGGGSSNAATIMKELVCHFHLKASDEQLVDIGKKYSCDIPFFIYGKPALVQGAGEKVSFINSDFKCNALLIKPSYGISSEQAYRSINITLCKHPCIEDMLYGLKHMQYEKIFSSVGNSFLYNNPKLSRKYYTLAPVLKKIGFDAVSITGTGSCFFALTMDSDILSLGYHALIQRQYPFVQCVDIPYILSQTDI